MLKRNSLIKGNAKEALLGNYPMAIAVMLIPFIINGMLDSPFSTRQTQGIYNGNLFDILIGYAGMLVISLLSALLYSGMQYAHLNIARGIKPGIADLIFPFKHAPNRYIIFGLIQMGISAVCSAPAIILEVLSIYAYPHEGFAAIDYVSIVFFFLSFVFEWLILLGFAILPYILLDNESMGIVEAIKLSFAMMKGNKIRLILLFITFIGWLLLGVMTFFIGFIWIIPYIVQSLTQFYEDLKANYNNY